MTRERPKHGAQLFDAIGDGRWVGRVSWIHLGGHRTPLAIGQHSIDDDGQVLLFIPTVAEHDQRASAPVIETTTDVVENDGPFGQVTPGEFLFNARLSLEQSIERSVKLVNVHLAEGELLRKGRAVP